MYNYIDMHCDTLLKTLYEGEDSIYGGDGMQSFKLMKEAKQLCQFFAIFFPPANIAGKKLPKDDELFELLTNTLQDQISRHNEIIGIAHNYDEIINNSKNNKSSAVLTIEDGRMINKDMEKLHYAYEKGVRAIALTWNYPNCFGYPNSKDKDIMLRGLTDFGKQAVEEMNRLGILVDVSHLSDGGFYDVADISSKPFIASHSNCRSLTDHTRNLTDDMISRLAEKGGVAGINFGPEFSGSKNDNVSRIDDLVSQVIHFINVGGEDCVGIGTDFDGVGGELEISHPTRMHLLFDKLEKKGLKQSQIDKLAQKNVLRVIKDGMK